MGGFGECLGSEKIEKKPFSPRKNSLGGGGEVFYGVSRWV